MLIHNHKKNKIRSDLFNIGVFPAAMLSFFLQTSVVMVGVVMGVAPMPPVRGGVGVMVRVEGMVTPTTTPWGPATRVLVSLFTISRVLAV